MAMAMLFQPMNSCPVPSMYSLQIDKAFWVGPQVHATLLKLYLCLNARLIINVTLALQQLLCFPWQQRLQLGLQLLGSLDVPLPLLQI